LIIFIGCDIIIGRQNADIVYQYNKRKNLRVETGKSCSALLFYGNTILIERMHYEI